MLRRPNPQQLVGSLFVGNPGGRRRVYSELDSMLAVIKGPSLPFGCIPLSRAYRIYGVCEGLQSVNRLVLVDK